MCDCSDTSEVGCENAACAHAGPLGTRDDGRRVGPVGYKGDALQYGAQLPVDFGPSAAPYDRRTGIRERPVAGDHLGATTVKFCWPEAAVPLRIAGDHAATSLIGRVEMWRGGRRFGLSVAAPFVWRCPSTRALMDLPRFGGQFVTSLSVSLPSSNV